MRASDLWRAFKDSLNSRQVVDIKQLVEGTLYMHLGCQDCPYRKYITMPVNTSALVQPPWPLPVIFVFDMRVNKPGVLDLKMKLPPVGVGDCKEAGERCEWQTHISQMHEAVLTNPNVLRQQTGVWKEDAKRQEES